MILVCGATGLLGSRIVEHLIEAEQPVRAFVRPDTDASALQASGVAIARGDLRGPTSVRAALAGVDFSGRPLLDATNPIGPGLTLTHGHDDSGGEQVQRWAPTARVVKVFNTTGRENMEAPSYPAGASVMLACGDDGDAVDLAVRLARDIGFDAHPFGPLASARVLEPFALVWIKLAMQYGQGRDFALGLLRR